MSNSDSRNSEGEEVAPDADGDLYPEVHLCISCLAENLPTYNFCHDCGCPIDFCATVPFQQEWAIGWIYRAAVAQPTVQSFLAMNLVFGWHLFGGCVALFGFLSGFPLVFGELSWFGLPLGLFWFGVGLAGMLRLAINYCPDAPIEES